MEYIAHKSFVGQVEKVEKDGVIFMFGEEIPVNKGELVFKNLKGEQQLITKKQLDNDFVGVKIAERPKINLNEMAKGYIEMGDINLDLCK